MQPEIVIIDYGMGNLRSVLKKVERLHKSVQVSADLKVIENAQKLILPGVGHFASGIKKLKESGIWEVLNQKVLEVQTPILGICLGMQLMAKCSEEGNAEGLGWLDAEVVRFKVNDTRTYKVPHMGWNTVEIQKESPLFAGVSQEAMYYFVHSYYMKCHDAKDTLGSTNYALSFTSAIQKNNIYGTQFHPEKSHEWGDRLIQNFIALPA
ncbi:imidazole glycerol phosphate synthase subunit HisH [Runella sp. CRIBMP]|uniref:imidazole glycerol phosphate synthase subunit HisH n=1 Tax=Runella sp. CRIBMP TaxID=2683261 RepID=UPI0014124F96|nr:imidazole glycerol phosphate synthase subunit HisH [Runella sp. CRIBMP]NBB22962.1 imidazole glycerol phosphate synthase subunit HisH [Runella sp. CRIBMP]